MTEKKKLEKISPLIARLNLGEVKVIDGIVFGLMPKAPPVKTLLAGLPESLSTRLTPLLAAIDSPDVKEDNYILAHKSAHNIFAHYYGANFSASKKEKLGNLYSVAFEKAFDIQKDVIKKSLDLILAQKSLAKIMGDTAIEEMKFFAGHSKAQMRRYRNWRGAKVQDTELARELFSKAFLELLSGAYLKTDRRLINREQKILKRPYTKRAVSIMDKARFYTPSMSNYIESRVVDFLSHLHRDQRRYEYQEDVYSVALLGWNTKIYSAEHSILSDSVESELSDIMGDAFSSISGDLGLFHTSIIGGVWKISKQHLLIKKVDRQTGQVVHQEKATRFHVDFDEWLVANGCASWIESNDELILLDEQYFSEPESAKQYLRGQTPDPGGNYYPVRACSYPVGTYGINWVCHQNANAFTERKYGWKRIDYLTTLIYGTCGNFYWPIIGPEPVSTRKCRVPGCYPHFGGIPGSSLYYNIAPQYGGLLGVFLDPLMRGAGYGLHESWDPQQQAWRPTNAAYTEESIPFAVGPNWQATYSGWI
jgi:hypothetical protein